MLSELKWNEFNFVDIFQICEGFYNKRPESNEKGTIPFIGATDSNNGITQFCTIDTIEMSSKTGSGKNDPINKKIFKGNCICVTNNGSVGYAYYQKSPFTCTHDVNPLYLKNYKLNMYIAMFLISAIEKQRVCFKYSRKWRPSRMVKSKLLLPVNKIGEPDYILMERIVKETLSNKNELIKDYLKSKCEMLNNSFDKVENVNEKEHASFKIVDLFEPKRGNQNNMESLTIGDIPLISAKNVNNGLKSFCSKNEKSIFNGNCLTLNNDGDGGVGLSYYQPFDYLLDSHVTALYPKFDSNIFVLLFISNAIKKQRVLFSHGRSISSSRLKELRVILPITQSGSVDFEYMGNYVKEIMFNKYKEMYNKICAFD